VNGQADDDISQGAALIPYLANYGEATSKVESGSRPGAQRELNLNKPCMPEPFHLAFQKTAAPDVR
jgi:hypothetical protein